MQKRSSWNRLAFAALILAGFGLSACNTVEGAGEDIQAGGKAIEKTAEDVKN